MTTKGMMKDAQRERNHTYSVSFDFVQLRFCPSERGPPTMPLMTPASAQEGLAGAPIGAASHRHVEKVVTFVAIMLGGATRRSNGDNRVRR